MSKNELEHLCKNPYTNEIITEGLDIDLEGNIVIGKRWGIAISDCYGTGGELFVHNGEYENKVKYCPFCGFTFNNK